MRQSERHARQMRLEQPAQSNFVFGVDNGPQKADGFDVAVAKPFDDLHRLVERKIVPVARQNCHRTRSAACGYFPKALP
ncbi:hypothetical protein IGS74_19055 [Aureimonas sp. OT7]|uniref:hypothetical protein n=1 Tax=Aureimonas sp. OT7 TaxID=2816454 RepID=UPI00177F16B7|nr:hypothetical protein [Aureimonas sp. OT7]QOG06575.1 hypothetical protein IGS74_19055 [Aureimonas sp. OT7]